MSDDRVNEALEQLTSDQIERKGFIRATQVGQILRTMGQAFEERDLKQLIREFDSDGSGEIEFEEFAAMVANFVVSGEDNEGLQQELREAFRLYDKEGNGYINVSDLREILRALDDKITDDELDEMIAEIDTDGSGTVDFDGKSINSEVNFQHKSERQSLSQSDRTGFPLNAFILFIFLNTAEPHPPLDTTRFYYAIDLTQPGILGKHPSEIDKSVGNKEGGGEEEENNNKLKEEANKPINEDIIFEKKDEKVKKSWADEVSDEDKEKDY
uniref:EF-hand domain-containing protein n=1 Tax=Meloidogyne floridensis TaxID=298350 RepID=A0A915P958_9BILA